ncbi:hypothetical protein TOK_5064 [Pseudonocardia sp. N23]|nr:hypothetical protein TOK_5064 [Pseudonocardia sp. N23]
MPRRPAPPAEPPLRVPLGAHRLVYTLLTWGCPRHPAHHSPR